MPIYDFECPKCEWQTECWLSLKDHKRELTCINCGTILKRVITKPILTCLPHDKRRWGTSLHRKHEKGERIGKKKEKEVG